MRKIQVEWKVRACKERQKDAFRMIEVGTLNVFLYFVVTNPASVLTEIILFYSPNTK